MKPTLPDFRKFLRSTPLRLTAGLVALFALVSLISLGATYLIVRDSIDSAMQDDIELELSVFEETETATELGELVKARANGIDPEQRIISYITPRGRHFGNGVIPEARDKFRIVRLSGDDDRHEGNYLVRGEDMHGGLLAIAISREQIDDLGELFVNILLLSLLPTTLIAFTAGILIARRSAQRIDAVNSTLNRLAEGDLSARVSTLSGRADDVSAIAEQVDRMATAQQSSVEALKQVSADIAHDLKTPIQRVSVLLSQASETPDLPARLEDILAQAGQETQGIVATFQSLLQIAQIEGGSPKGRFKPVDLGALAATFVEVYEPNAEESGHILIADLPAIGTCIVSGEQVLLGQLIANLIENAMRHTPSGSQIEVRARTLGQKIELTIADTGPGIPADERQNVLRRLYRLEQSRTTPGNGLGLSLVAVIAELHDADLELGSNHPGLSVKIVFDSASDHTSVPTL